MQAPRRMSFNVVLNLMGQAIPLVFAVFTVPYLINQLGKDRYSILTLAWTIIGYFSLFDLGLGRALTHSVAERLGTNEEVTLQDIVWSGMLAMLGLGVIGALFTVVISDGLVYKALLIPNKLQAETLSAFRLLAVGIPVVILSAGFQGVLEAKQRFDITNLARIPLGIFSYVGPALVAYFTQNLVIVIVVLIVSRVFILVTYAVACFRVLPVLKQGINFKKEYLGELLRFGSWMTVSNIIGPIIQYTDRFLIGAIVSISALAYYAAPYDVVTKLWIIPTALCGVLFPTFSASYRRDIPHLNHLFWRGIKYISVVMFFICLVCMYLAYDLINLWLGADFAAQSTLVLQLLALGVFINSIAQIPSTLIQSLGRPDLKAKIHLVEFIPYILALVWVLNSFGLPGAALAFLVRILIDAILFFYVLFRTLPAVHPTNVMKTLPLVVAGMALLLLPLLLPANPPYELRSFCW